MLYARALYATAVFAAAFLLFFIQPIAGKELLPLLGGSAAVWVTCLVFFQLMLLLGYSYAHWITARNNSIQAHVHCILLTLAVASLFFQARYPLNSTRIAEHPVLSIFFNLGLRIGLPVIMLAATSPLIQTWLTRRRFTEVPYRIFALGNVGSLLALLSYPTVVEPVVPLHLQRSGWGIAFLLFAILGGVVTHHAKLTADLRPKSDKFVIDEPDPLRVRRFFWFVLPMLGGIQLSAVTQYVTQDVAPVPLLWLLPLAIYLVTFIVAFDRPGIYRRATAARMFAVCIAMLGLLLTRAELNLPIAASTFLFLLELFAACYFCHAETAALRPQRSSELTRFYLAIAAGGVTGTFIVGIVSPMLFTGNYDLPATLALSAITAFTVTWFDGWSQRMLWGVEAVGLCILVVLIHTAYMRQTVVQKRNFYGSLRVTQSTQSSGIYVRTLLNGSTKHGSQWFGADSRSRPTTYYGAQSGVGLALRYCCLGHPKNVGVIGLGAGTLAAYGRPGDRFTFYEINPAVKTIAENTFTYLRDSKADVRIFIGDARESLADQPSQRYDVVVIDAFSGDAIPMHLLTKQAIDLYRRHLTLGGILAFHISNRYLDLAPEIRALASAEHMQSKLFLSPTNQAQGELSAKWVLVTDNSTFFAVPEIVSSSQDISASPKVRLWTDDYSSLLKLLRWRSGSED